MKKAGVCRVDEKWMRFAEWQIRQHTDIPEEGVQRALRDIREVEENGGREPPYKKVRGWP